VAEGEEIKLILFFVFLGANLLEGLPLTRRHNAITLVKKDPGLRIDFEEGGTRAQTSSASGLLAEGQPGKYSFFEGFSRDSNLTMGDDVVCIDDDGDVAPPSPASKARMELEAQQRRQRREEKRRQVNLGSLFCCLPDPSPSVQISLHDLPFQRELAAARAGGGGAGGASNANAVMIDLTDENAAPVVPAAQPAVQPPRQLPPYLAPKADPVGGAGASASVNLAAAAAASKQLQVGQPQERARAPYAYVPPPVSEMDSIANMARALRDQALKANLVQQQKQAAAPPSVVPPHVPHPKPQVKHAQYPYPGECHPSSLCQTMTCDSISQGCLCDSRRVSTTTYSPQRQLRPIRI